MTQASESPQPIFVVGAVRAGTTMFRLMLGAHPQCHIFGEFEMSVAAMPESGWPTMEDYYEHLEHDRVFNTPPQATIDRSLNYPELVRSLFSQYCGDTKARYGGASIHSRFHRCPDIWPEAKFIHVLRDPRDVARSCIGMGWVGNVFYGADIWLEAERNWDKLCQVTEAHQRFEVRYEELVSEPERVLKEACAFLELEYTKEMLSYGDSTTYTAPDAKYAYQWKKKLSDEQRWQVESKCRELMIARGYEPASSRTSPPGPHERLGLLVHNRTARAQNAIKKYGLPLWLAQKLKPVAPQKFSLHVSQRMNAVDHAHLK